MTRTAGTGADTRRRTTAGTLEPARSRPGPRAHPGASDPRTSLARPGNGSSPATGPTNAAATVTCATSCGRGTRACERRQTTWPTTEVRENPTRRDSGTAAATRNATDGPPSDPFRKRLVQKRRGTPGTDEALTTTLHRGSATRRTSTTSPIPPTRVTSRRLCPPTTMRLPESMSRASRPTTDLPALRRDPRAAKKVIPIATSVPARPTGRASALGVTSATPAHATTTDATSLDPPARPRDARPTATRAATLVPPTRGGKTATGEVPKARATVPHLETSEDATRATTTSAPPTTRVPAAVPPRTTLRTSTQERAGVERGTADRAGEADGTPRTTPPLAGWPKATRRRSSPCGPCGPSGAGRVLTRGGARTGAATMAAEAAAGARTIPSTRRLATSLRVRDRRREIAVPPGETTATGRRTRLGVPAGADR